MSSWQTKMSQTYTGTYDGNEPNFYGIAFPAAFSNANAQGHFVFDNTQEDVTWDPTNQSQADLKVLAVAVGHRNDAATALILYFFAVKNGQPVVYVSQTTNGPQVYFQKTDNADLQNGFAKLYNK
ncbi:lipoprotein [Fructobacillus ficulneus]|uniref:Lipoprotein n=2 Tax=Fructobacillus ficulneus TaxID=157463 RepID=A0A0K8MIR6_9LACO|nr:lipoprotein [Fructobacillus ficulneus]